MDDRLVERLLAKESAAWEEFLSRFGGKVEAACRRTLLQGGVPSDSSAVADAVAEVVRALLDKDARLLRRFRPGGSLGAYLHVVARGVTIDGLRRRDPEALPWLEESFSRDPAELPRKAELEERVREALAALPAREAELLRLFHLEGLSYREISERTGVPEGQVGVYLLRARETLKERLGPGILEFL